MKYFVAIISIALNAQLTAQVTKICDLKSLSEISGSIKYNNQYWVNNDGGNSANLYLLDTATGSVIDSTTFGNVSNQDWEDLATNSTHCFIGDFGNNSGTRTNLGIYKFPLSKLGNKGVYCDTISFFYPQQQNFNSNPLTIYDCEALVAFEDSILIFSKSLLDAVCRIYSIPNKPGKHAVRLLDTLQLGFWITGASLFEDQICLIGYGYNGDFTPQMRLGYFKNGRMLRAYSLHQYLNYSGPKQVESCITEDITGVTFTSEKSNGYEAACMQTKITQALSTHQSEISALSIFPNPSKGSITVAIEESWSNGRLIIHNMGGKVVYNEKIRSNIVEVYTGKLSPGNYTISVQLKGKKSSQLLVIN